MHINYPTNTLFFICVLIPKLNVCYTVSDDNIRFAESHSHEDMTETQLPHRNATRRKIDIHSHIPTLRISHVFVMCFAMHTICSHTDTYTTKTSKKEISFTLDCDSPFSGRSLARLCFCLAPSNDDLWICCLCAKPFAINMMLPSKAK